MSWLQAQSRQRGWSPPAPTAEQAVLESQPEARAQLESSLSAEMDRLRALEKSLQKELQPVSAGPPAWETDPKQLADLEQTLAAQPPNLMSLRTGYFAVRLHWRAMVADFLSWLKDARLAQPPDPLPEFQARLYYPIRDGEIAREYVRLYQQLTRLRGQLVDFRSKAWLKELEIKRNSGLRLAQLRQNYLSRLYALGYVPALDGEAHWSEDVSLEASIIPSRYRVMALAAGSRYQQLLALGYPGYYGLLESLAWLLLIPLVPVVVFQGQKQIRERILQKVGGRSARPLLGRLFPWLVQYLILKTEVYLLQGTVLEMASSLLQIGAAYVVYRGYLEVVESLLPTWVHWLARSAPLETAGRADRLARWLGRMLLAEAVLIYLVLSATGPNLIFQTASRILLALNLLVYVLVTVEWRREIGILASRLLPNAFGQALERLCQRAGTGRLLAPFMVPLLALVAALNWLLAQTVRFEWGRRVSAGFLRQWHEQTQKSTRVELEPVSADYIAQFSSLPVEAGRFAGPMLDELRLQLDRRLQGSRLSPSLSVVGASGSGLSSINDWIAQIYREQLQVLRISVPARTIQPEAVLDLLKPALNGEGRALVLVEEAHNLFLAEPGGFEGARALMDSVMAHAGRLVWCISLHEQAYLYMTRVIANRHGFGLMLRIAPCNERELAHWILHRHKQLGGELHYGFSLLRTEDEPRARNAAQESFFRVLWQQSGGIRRVAQELWFQSLHQDPNHPGGWLVDLPPRHDLTALSQASAEMLFVFTAIVRHHNLTQEEAHKVTSLSLREVSYALQLGLECGVLTTHGEGNTRYYIHPAWSTELQNFLRRKNLLYDA